MRGFCPWKTASEGIVLHSGFCDYNSGAIFGTESAGKIAILLELIVVIDVPLEVRLHKYVLRVVIGSSINR